MIKHVVMTSGGICSWAAGTRVAAKHGLESTRFLFADTIIEDDDLYRFLIESISHIAGRPRKYQCFSLPPLTDMESRKETLARLRKDTTASFPCMVWVADGRTPWDLMHDQKCIARSGLDICSRVLKRELLNKWVAKNAPESTRHYGIDWTESHRLEGVRKRNPGIKCEAPMCDEPFLTKLQMLELLRQTGIKPPRLYGAGFPHNNCGGFCVKAGIAHFVHLLRTMPDRFQFHEEQEESIRAKIGDHSILKDRTGGANKRLTLKSLREKIQQQGEFDVFDWGGCGCALE